MKTNKTPRENQIEELDVDSTSVDDFIKELEEKERDLEISSDLVIEVGDSEVEHQNIHDSFVPNIPINNRDIESTLTGKLSPVPTKRAVNEESSADSLERLSQLTDEVDELKESLSRRKRDFDNYRTRTDRERADTFRNVLSSLATKMLPVIDNLNRALDAFSDVDSKEKGRDMKTFHEGIILVSQQLNEVLSNMGVREISAVDGPFDPKYHEAVTREETDDVPPDTVIEEILRGYRIDDTVIRPSMVKVAVSTVPLNTSEDDK